MPRPTGCSAKRWCMTELIVAHTAIPAMGPAAVSKVRALEAIARKLPQVPLETHHILHGGLYARTIRIPAGVTITGALIKVATVLIVRGDVLIYVGDEEPLRLEGYNVLPASAGRKQAFATLADTHITMICSTEVRTVE